MVEFKMPSRAKANTLERDIGDIVCFLRRAYVVCLLRRAYVVCLLRRASCSKSTACVERAP